MQFSIKSKANSTSMESASTKRRGGSTPNDVDTLGNAPVDTAPSAPWRVENLRTGGAPVESDWWVDGEQPQKKKNKSIFACFEEDASSRVGTSNGGETIGSKSSSQSSLMSSLKMVGSTPSCASLLVGGGDFQNCGLSTWEKVRKEWSTQTVEERPAPPPKLAKYESVKAGLSQVRRTFELPGRMTLPDMVELYVDVWEGEQNGDMKPGGVGGVSGVAQETIGVFCRSKSRRRRQGF